MTEEEEQPPPRRPRPSCACGCGIRGPLKGCGWCRSVGYVNKEHQLRDRPWHSLVCSQIKTKGRVLPAPDGCLHSTDLDQWGLRQSGYPPRTDPRPSLGRFIATGHLGTREVCEQVLGTIKVDYRATPEQIIEFAEIVKHLGPRCDRAHSPYEPVNSLARKCLLRGLPTGATSDSPQRLAGGFSSPQVEYLVRSIIRGGFCHHRPLAPKFHPYTLIDGKENKVAWHALVKRCTESLVVDLRAILQRELVTMPKAVVDLVVAYDFITCIVIDPFIDLDERPVDKWQSFFGSPTDERGGGGRGPGLPMRHGNNTVVFD